MAEGKKRYKAVIGKRTYTIIGTESKAHMDMVTVLANQQLQEIATMAPETTLEQQGILVALNTLSDQVKKQQQLNALEKENSALNQRVETLESKLQQYEKKATYIDDQMKYIQSMEKRIKRYEELEEQAKQALKENGQEATDLTPGEAQEIVNQRMKEKIQQNHNEAQNS